MYQKEIDSIEIRDYSIAFKILFFAISILLLLVFVSCQPIDNTPPEVNYTLDAIAFDHTVYEIGSPMQLSLIVEHTATDQRTFWIGVTLVDPLDNPVDFPTMAVTLDSGLPAPFSLNLSMADHDAEALYTGPYKLIVSLWDGNPEEEEATRLTSYIAEDAIRMYRYHEDFNAIDDTVWHSREGILGRTRLSSDNVFVEDDLLIIKHPEGTLDGGEIQTIDFVHFGSYEIKMKVPHAPTSITGFFLYKAPDYDYEIDIEIFNQSESEVWFTTYTGGAIVNEHKEPLGFDPTAGFNVYRIDYFPSYVAFFVNDVEYMRWHEGYPSESMYLMVNSWFPNWLEGEKPDADERLEVEWLRY